MSLQDFARYLQLSYAQDRRLSVGSEVDIDDENITITKLLKFLTLLLKLNIPKENILKLEIPCSTWNKVRLQTPRTKGVYATKNIACGEVITLYPCHVLTFDVTEFSTFYLPVDNVPNDIYDNIRQNSNLYLTSPKTNSDHRMIGHPSITNSLYLGHMCNDGARSSCPRDKEIYETCSLAKRNATMTLVRNLCTAIIATRNIVAEEEIFLSYGYDYWKLQHS
jgi:hypothetical protein